MSLNLSQPHFIVESQHDWPLCRFQVILCVGARTDVFSSQPGLCHFATELMRRGAAGISRQKLDESLDKIGASLEVYCGHDSVTFDLQVLKPHLSSALRIMADIILRPDFSAAEAGLLQREILAHLQESLSDDRGLASRFFSRSLYENTGYSWPIMGTLTSVPQLTDTLAKQWYQQYFSQSAVIFGAAGDLSLAETKSIWEQYFKEIPQRELNHLPKAESPISRSGMHLLLVDKPERTQTQILIGQTAPAWQSSAWLPLHIATTAFGGMFCSTLMKEVRVKRGLSYGASAQLGAGKNPMGLCLHVFPAAAQAHETLSLVLKLYNEWATDKINEETSEFAKNHLAKSHAFDIQTPDNRLRFRTKLFLCDMPSNYMETLPEKILNTSTDSIKEAVKMHLRPKDLFITVVGTANELLPSLQTLTSSVQVLAYDSY